MQENSVGLVLSGGGIRGMAHIGLIQAMEEHGIEADVVSGTSIGALVGALYANGNSVKEMLAFFQETPLFKYNFFAINKPGFIDTERYYPVFKKHFPNDAFEALNKKLYVVATDLLKGEERVFHEGDLIKPLLASAALTPVFSPVDIDGTLFADGGVMNNFPKEYVNESGRIIIGSNVSIAGEVGKKDLKNSLQLAGRITGLMIYASSHKKLKECDTFIEPAELEKIGVLDKKGIETAYRIGYEHGVKAISKIMERKS